MAPLESALAVAAP